MGTISEKVGQAKSWWKSKTIIGTILMIIPMFLTIVAPESNIDVSGAIDTAWEGAEGLATYADSIWAKNANRCWFCFSYLWQNKSRCRN